MDERASCLQRGLTNKVTAVFKNERAKRNSAFLHAGRLGTLTSVGHRVAMPPAPARGVTLGPPKNPAARMKAAGTSTTSAPGTFSAPTQDDFLAWMLRPAPTSRCTRHRTRTADCGEGKRR